MKSIVVSACLLGENCKYGGGNNLCKEVIELKEKYDIISVCPEQLGGLKTPRNPAEICGDKVVTNNGVDVTYEYLLGAKKVLQIAKENNCVFAVLKARSPSCGKGVIYNGTFTKTTVSGNGKTADILLKNGIKVFTENELDIIKKSRD